MEVVQEANGLDGKVHIDIQMMSFSSSIHPVFLNILGILHVRALFLSYMGLKVVGEFRNY